MKFVNEYRDPSLVRLLAEKIKKTAKKNWTIMEVCGGQTHSIVRSGLNKLLPDNIQLIHGPGCPVCVTPIDLIDMAIAIALTPNTILCSFGDMLRVPGSSFDLIKAKALGADVRIILSPIDAVHIAKKNPNKEVVLFAVGFETTAPTNGMTIKMANDLKVVNFSLLSSHVLVPPAIKYIMSDPESKVDGFLAAGHVCTVTGYKQYHELAKATDTPIIITGFEPVDIMQGISLCVDMLEKQETGVKNQYSRVVKESGNRQAQELISDVFTVVDRHWRGIGSIPSSGLDLSSKYKTFDATYRFTIKTDAPSLDSGCLSGMIMQGKCKPSDCPHFGKKCTPQTPLGAPMVSTEGACSAYYLYCDKGSS
ncbi:MAG: hydrogenase formation protein HypD [Chlamydiae bacterium]|nr:hydrogenase formation protein HypD [Chlamydiota bacterium]